jgi:multisubunit Na+/H+ antiporter MnhB subunit
MLVIAGIRLVINPGDEEGIEKQKKVVGYTAVGIIVIGLADTLVNRVIFPEGGYFGPSVRAFSIQLRGISNYILGFVGGVILIAVIISGLLMLINYGNEEMFSKIKTTMKNIAFGCLIIFSAYTVITTLITTLMGE